MAQHEYLPGRRVDGALTAPNRAHGLRVTWTGEGVEITDRLGGDRLVSLATTGVGRASRVDPLEPAVPTMGPSFRVERHWAQASEWWENAAEGVEQGWVVRSPPEGSGALTVVVAVRDAELRSSGADLEFSAAGGRRLSYGKLAASDARGRELAVRLRPEQGAFRIEVEDQDAQYPVTIDPVITAAADWTFNGPPGGQAGFSVAGAGDVNGDGFSDVIVGAPSFDNGVGVLGAAFVFHGSPSGLALPNWVAPSSAVGGQFGISVASAGDVNGDGFGDVVVGALSFTNVQAQEGRVQVFLGSASGVSPGPASWVMESNQATAYFGGAVAGAGDVNGDGFDDLLVGAVNQGIGGRVSLFLGGSSGPAQSASWTYDGELSGAGFGGSVSTAGDVNGDGLSDVIIGASAISVPEAGEGRVYVFLGRANSVGLDPMPTWTREGNQVDSSLGSSVSTAGDVNGDGLSDVIVGARGFSGNQASEGHALVFLANGSGSLEPAPWVTIELSQASAAVGSSVSAAGDVNGDGYGDVLVGAELFNGAVSDEGTVRLYLGGSTSLRPQSNWPGQLNLAGANLGRSVAGVGDVNRDGFSDFVVGAPGAGRALLYLGSSAGPSRTASDVVDGTLSRGLFGQSVAGVGDVNGDGFGDMVIGAPQEGIGALMWEGNVRLYAGSQQVMFGAPTATRSSGSATAFLGYSVARAGDVNGDGFADVIAGAFSAGVGGRALVFMGSASGWPVTPSLTLEPGQVDAAFGVSVAGAGDVNGDGYADVIVGAHQYDDGEVNEGAAFLYLGSAAGLRATPDRVLQVNQAQAAFGVSVASAGDVDGDGYDDVVVGATGADKAWVFLGSPLSVSLAAPLPLSGTTGSSFGASVAGGADLNGDGFSDVVVGAPDYASGQGSEGQLKVFYGGRPVFASSWAFESDAVGARLGLSVAMPGDVNGDGFDDVVVGGPGFVGGALGEGAALIFPGSRSTVAPAPFFRSSGGQFDCHFGSAVAGAGDVNGDGLADLLVSAVDYDGPPVDRGQVRLFAGGDGAPGAPRALLQKFQGTPLGAGGWRSGAAVLSARALRADFPAATRVAIEFELKPIGTVFDGGATLMSSPVAGGQVASVSVGGLAAARYHWRSRLRFKTGAGRWIPFGANGEWAADFVVPDGGGPMDGGFRTDAGVVLDAGAAVDAGVVDAGSVIDAGVVDAGLVIDAGVVDAGAVIDAGVVDAGVVDAGSVIDAGVAVDAGVVDAGVMVDAGVEVDPGVSPTVTFVPVCGCGAGSDSTAGLLALLAMAALRRRR